MHILLPSAKSSQQPSCFRGKICFCLLFLAVICAQPQSANAYVTDTNAQGQTTYTFSYTGASEAFIVPVTRAYKIELWGASGGDFNDTYLGGKGGYVKGEVNLVANETLYLYLGQEGPCYNAMGLIIVDKSWNGGGNVVYTNNNTTNLACNGGGATDIRLLDGSWDEISSLHSRLMIAAGGGGGVYNGANYGTGGSSGGLMGQDGMTTGDVAGAGAGGTQLATGHFVGGSIPANLGGFGYGGSPNNGGTAGGGGGGYYGGGPGQSLGRGGGGGSSFISGHTGSVAIISASNQAPKNTCGVTCTTGINNNCCSIHYSNKSFTSTTMIDGAGYNWTNVKGSLAAMPNPNGGNYASGIGHTGNGVARITLLNVPPTLPTPDPTATNSADPSIGAFASYNTGFDSLVLAGTVNDADSGQTLTIQYQIDSTAGSWSNLTTLTANGSNQPWSGTVNLPSGLTAGSHTIYIRVYDGYSYSPNKSVSFVLDLTAPTNTVSLVGGVLCTGITTIYCTAPTGINLSTSSDGSGAGIGAYRIQWDTTFTAGDVGPAWTAGAPPSNLSTTGHTAAAATHTLYYQTRDTVGNVSAVESISYYVNSTPEVEINDANHNQVITPYTPLVLSGTFTDLDPTQTVTVKATINGIDYVSQTYPATSSVVAWEIVIPASSLLGLSPSQLTNFPLTITDSAGVSSIAYYTGQISVSSSTSSEIYLSVIKNIPFSLTIGKVGAFNITFGTNQGITVSTNSSDEIIVSGSLSSPVSIPFGVTDLVFTVLEEPSFEVGEVEFR